MTEHGTSEKGNDLVTPRSLLSHGRRETVHLLSLPKPRDRLATTSVAHAISAGSQSEF